MNEDYHPRFSFEITGEQQLRANKLLTTHGIRKAIFQVILDDLLDLIEDHGQVIVGVLLAQAAKTHEILPTMHEAKRKGEA